MHHLLCISCSASPAVHHSSASPPPAEHSCSASPSGHDLHSREGPHNEKWSDRQKTENPTGCIHKEARKKSLTQKKFILIRGFAFENYGPSSKNAQRKWGKNIQLFWVLSRPGPRSSTSRLLSVNYWLSEIFLNMAIIFSEPKSARRAIPGKRLKAAIIQLAHSARITFFI